jgi:hypothetical protein
MGSYVFQIAALGLMCALAVGSPAAVASAMQTVSGPTVVVPAKPAAPGDTVTVRLNGWPRGTVTVGVCGNEARRGSEDCALIGDEAIAVRGSATTPVDLTILAPPVPCPCVVRASEADGSVALTARITLLGVPTGPPLAPTGPVASDQLDVQGQIKSSSSWVHALSRSLAGPSSKTLVLTLHNRGRSEIEGLRVVSDVGRSASSGSPLAVRAVAALEPGAQVTLRIPVTLGAPAFGEYQVTGTVYGLASPAQFGVTTNNDPWALELLAPITLLALAQILRRRERQRERAGGDDPGTTAGSSTHPHRSRSGGPAHAWNLASA